MSCIWLLDSDLGRGFLGDLAPEDAAQVSQISRRAQTALAWLRRALAFALSRPRLGTRDLSLRTWLSLLEACTAAVVAEGLTTQLLARSVRGMFKVEEEQDECTVQDVPASCMRSVLQLAWRHAQASCGPERQKNPEQVLVQFVGQDAKPEGTTTELAEVAAVLSMTAEHEACDWHYARHRFEARGLLALVDGSFAAFGFSLLHADVHAAHGGAGVMRGAVVAGSDLGAVLNVASNFFPRWRQQGGRLSWDLCSKFEGLGQVKRGECSSYPLLCAAARTYHRGMASVRRCEARLERLLA